MARKEKRKPLELTQPQAALLLEGLSKLAWATPEVPRIAPVLAALEILAQPEDPAAATAAETAAPGA